MAETNTAALRAQGERDARALTVTGRRRADTGRIRRAGKALARMARAVTPETPNGQWLRDNRSFACAAAGDAVAALRHARVRASGGQTALGACCAGLLRACGGALTVKAAAAYLEGFQDALPLETAVLALLVPGLQAAVVCALAESYTGDGAAAPALFTSLRALGTAAWGMLAERCDRVGRILARDPVGVYPAMDAATRTHYRQTVARLARRTGRTEIEIAEDVLARARGRDAPPAQPRRGGCAARRGHARLRPAAPAHGHRAAERERHGLGARVRRAGRRRPLRRRVRGAVYGLL